MNKVKSYPLLEREGDNIKVFWSGTITEFVITIEGLMKANNWSREKACKFIEELTKEIKNEGKKEITEKETK